MKINRTDIHSILVTAPLSVGSRIQLERLGKVVYEPWVTDNEVKICGPKDIAKRIVETEADLLVCQSDLCSGPVFDSGVKIIAACRNVPGNIDIAGAIAAGIPVLYTPGSDADAIAEHTLALLFSLNQNLLIADKEFRADINSQPRVPYQRYRSEELRGKVFGIVGLNETGYAVKWRVEALGLETLVFDPYNPDAEVSKEDVLKKSHIISIHTPPIKETLGLMGSQEFAICRPGALYINTASSAIHDLDALTDALSKGQLSGAGLDLGMGEKLPPNHPLLEMENVVLSPGIGGISANTENRQGMMIIQDLLRLFEGIKPHNIANPEVLYPDMVRTKTVKISDPPETRKLKNASLSDRLNDNRILAKNIANDNFKADKDLLEA